MLTVGVLATGGALSGAWLGAAIGLLAAAELGCISTLTELLDGGSVRCWFPATTSTSRGGSTVRFVVVMTGDPSACKAGAGLTAAEGLPVTFRFVACGCAAG